MDKAYASCQFLSSQYPSSTETPEIGGGGRTRSVRSMFGDFPDELRYLLPFILAARIVQGDNVALRLFGFTTLSKIGVIIDRCDP